MQLIELDAAEERAGLHRDLSKEKFDLNVDIILMGILKDEAKDLSQWQYGVIRDRIYPSRNLDTFDPRLVNFLKRMGGKVTLRGFQFQLRERAVALRTRGGHPLPLSRYAKRFGIRPTRMRDIMKEEMETERNEAQHQDSSSKSESG